MMTYKQMCDSVGKSVMVEGMKRDCEFLNNTPLILAGIDLVMQLDEKGEKMYSLYGMVKRDLQANDSYWVNDYNLVCVS